MTSEHLATALAALLAMLAIATKPTKPSQDSPAFPERKVVQSTATPAVQGGDDTPDADMTPATVSEQEAVEPLAVSLPQQLAGVTRRETWPTSDSLEIAEVPSKVMANHTQSPTRAATCANGQCFAPSRGYQYQRRRGLFGRFR